MAIQRGILTQFAWKREAVIYGPEWPPTTIATTAVLPLLGEHIQDIRTTQRYAAAGNGIGQVTQDIVAQPVAGPVELQAHYQGLDGLLAAAFGHEALRIGSTAMPESLGSGVYRHLYELDVWHGGPWRMDDGWNMDDGLLMDQHKPCRGTVAIQKQVNNWEFNGVAIDTLTWQSASGEAARLTLDLLGYQLTEPASVNTSFASHTTVTAPIIAHHQIDFRLGAFSPSVALTTSDRVNISAFSVTIQNALGFDYGPLTGLSPGEMQRTTSPTVTSAFTVPQYATDTILGWHRNQTLLMGYARYTGAAIPSGGGQNWALRWYFPSCRVATLAHATVRGRIELVATLELFTPASAPAGFPSVSHADGALFAETIGIVSVNQMV